MSRKDNNSAIKQTLSRAYAMAGEPLSCQWCRKELPLTKLTVDHVNPRWNGGEHSAANAVLACGDCNTERDGWARFYAGLNSSPPGTHKEERRAQRWARRIFPSVERRYIDMFRKQPSSVDRESGGSAPRRA